MVVYTSNVVNLEHRLRLAEFKLNGVGFRGYTYRGRSVLNIGYSHYLVVWSSLTHRCRRQRLLAHPRLLEKYQQLKNPDPYRQRGIQNLAVSVRIKEGKKK